MKKAVVMFIFLSAVMSMLAALIFYVGRGPQGLKAEDVLSAGPVFYVRFVDLEKNLAKFQTTEFFKRVKDVDAATWMQGVEQAEGAAVFVGVMEQAFSRENIEAFLKLFGREAAVAYYSREAVWEGTFGQTPTLTDFSVVTRLDLEAQMFESLLGAVSRAGRGISRVSEEYRGKTIHVVRIEGLPFPVGYIRFGDLLVLGIGDAAARRAVDRVFYGSPALAQDGVFLEMRRKNINGAYKEGFLQYDVFAERMTDLFLAAYAADTEIQRNMAQGFKGMEGFKTFYFSSKYDGSVQSRFDMAYDVDRVSEPLRAIAEKARIRNRSLAFVPQTAKLYSWNAFFAPKFYWERFAKGTPQGGAEPQIFGLKMGDVMTLLTDEIGWYFSHMDLTGVTPIPHGIFFLGVSDTERMGALVQDSLESGGAWRFKTEMYKGREITYLENFIFLNGLEPAYCFLSGYFLLAPDRALVRQSIDVYESRERSMEKRAFVEKSKGMIEGKGSAFFWGDGGALVEEVSAFLRWGNTWADIQYSRQQALRSGARQRFENIGQEIAEKQKEVEDIEDKAEGARSRKKELLAVLDQAGGVEREIDRRRRILENAQGALRPVVQEEARLVAMRDDETVQLTADGLQMIAELQEEIARRRERIQEMQREVNLLQERQERLSEQARRMLEIEEEIAGYEKTLADGHRQIEQLLATRTEVENIIAGYGQPTLPLPEQRDLFLQGLVDPILDVLSQIQEFVFQSEVLDGGMRSEIFLKME